MWRPPERIRYEATLGRMPSRAEAAAARLFQPVAIGPVQLEQRTWVPAMVPWRATDEGYVTEEVIDWYERFARGRPGRDRGRGNGHSRRAERAAAAHRP